MYRIRSICLALLVCAWGTGAVAMEIPAGVVELHGRLESVVVVDERATPFPGNHASRSFLAATRLMSSVQSGSNRYGLIYVKGVARWSGYDSGDGSVRFEFDQGDYVWTYGGATPHRVRAFVNERRYFTNSVAPSLIRDDAIDAFANHGGVRIDGSRGTRLSWTALGALLDDGSDDTRGMGYAALRGGGRGVQGALSYLSNEVAADGAGHHAAIRGELAALYRKATLVLSYENTGLDDSAVFVPDGGFDWDGYVGGNFAESLSGAAAAFGEFRVGNIALRDRARLDVFHRYHAVGPAYAGGLSGTVAGTITNTTGIFVRHRTLALDGRLAYDRRVRWGVDGRASESLQAQARAFLKNGSEVYVRGAVGHRDEPGDVRTNDNFVHVAVRRSMRALEAGVHVMVENIDDGEFDRRFAAEMRMNWSANLALYCRLITAEDGAGHDAAFCRFELRPARHVFATLGFGRSHVGDGPYLVDDPDIRAVGTIESVYTVTVRGDF